jgi:hypothetical protein
MQMDYYNANRWLAIIESVEIAACLIAIARASFVAGWMLVGLPG